jgi:hypothetical protein
MSLVVDRIPTTRRGQVLTLAGAALGWIALYSLNPDPPMGS